LTNSPESATSPAEGIRWDKSEVSPALDVLEGLQVPTLDHVTEILNGYHRAGHHASYYDLICGEWILTFSHVLYAAYLHVQRGMPLERWSGVIPAFSDYGHFLRCVVEDPAFAGQLAAHVAALLAGDGAARGGFRAGPVRVGSGPAGGWRHRLREWKREAVGSFTKNDADFVFCQPHLNGCTRREWIAALWKWRKWAREENLDQAIVASVEMDAGWRVKTSAGSSDRSFEDLLRRMITLYMPAVYLEAWGPLKNQAHSLQISRPRAVYTSNSLHGHTLFKILSADWRLDGTKILNHQHGGNYGLDRVHAIENFETRVSDRFYTLGWKGQAPNQQVLPGALPAGVAGDGRPNRKILLNCIAYPPNVFRIHFQPMPGTVETMLDEMSAFIRETKGRADVTLRPSRTEYTVRVADLLQKIDGRLKVDDVRVPGIRSYAKYGMVVHSYLGTSWLETLALNIPTVCFYDPQTYVFRDRAAGSIQKLAAAGILHENGKGAAKFVLSVANDPRAWWGRAEVQEARAGFAAQYALFSQDWPDVWEDEFEKWIA
jgi:hypothetical protein